MLNTQTYRLEKSEMKDTIPTLSQRLAAVEAEVDRIRASICVPAVSAEDLQKNIRIYQELIELINESAEIMLGLVDNMPGPAAALDADQSSPAIHPN
jgi:hypothetical protein